MANAQIEEHRPIKSSSYHKGLSLIFGKYRALDIEENGVLY